MEPEPAPEPGVETETGTEPLNRFSDVTIEVVATGQSGKYDLAVGRDRVTVDACSGSSPEGGGIVLDGIFDRSAFSELSSDGGGMLGQGIMEPFVIFATVRLTNSSLARIKLAFTGPRRMRERDQLLALLNGERGLQLLEGGVESADTTCDLASLMREQEEAAARLAVDVGGVHLQMEGDLSSSDSDEDDYLSKNAPDPLEPIKWLTDRERREGDDLVTQAAALNLSDEERVQIAADCRIACTRGLAEVEFMQLTMVKVSTAIGLSDGDVAFFSDMGLDDKSAMPPKGSEIPLAQLAPPKRFGVIFVLVGTFTNEGQYDARHRAFLRRLAEAYEMEWSKIRAAETMHLTQMVVRKTEDAAGAQESQGATSWGRALKVGGAAVLGGAAMVLTAGVAAPAVVGVFGMVGLGGVLSAVGGAGFVSVMFGAAGAGLGGYKVARRTGDVAEFAFEPISEASSHSRTTLAITADLHDVEYVMASLTAISRQVSCRKVGTSQQQAMRAWEARDKIDAHVLCVVEPSGSWKEIENNATLDSARDQLSDEVTRFVNWDRQKRQLSSAGWVDPTGQPRFDDGGKLVGCRILVEGRGEGTVTKFKKSTFGSSEHVVKFDNVMAGNGSSVKLRRKGNNEERWLVHMDVNGSAERVDEMDQAASGSESTGMVVTIGVSGWLQNGRDSFQSHWQFLARYMAGSETHALKWESELLVDLGACFEDMVKGYLTSQVGKLVAVRVGLGAVTAALALPATLYTAAGVIDNPWSVTIARADKAGYILANLLLERQHGHRPVILMGWSTGARMVFTCLEALAAAPDGAGRGIVESAFLLGCPVEADAKRWATARSIVADRLVNGYAPGDWLLSLVSRASLNVYSIAGLSPIPHSNVENVHVGAYLGAKGHLKYRTRARRIFEALGVSESGITGDCGKAS